MFLGRISRKFCENSASAMNQLSAEHFMSPGTRNQLMQKLQSLPRVALDKDLPDRHAAVLVPFCKHDDGEISLLYTLRSSKLNSHAGHVAFPGGKRDPTDVSFTDTALRETEEELGIPRKFIQVWGESPLKLPSRNFDLAVTPVIGFIDNFDSLSLNPSEDEVEEVFSVPLRKLCDRQYFGFQTFKNGFTVPIFMAGPHKIWGLTAIVTHLVLSCLFTESVYPMQFKYLDYIPKSKM